VIERLKAYRKSGLIQCPRCGSRSIMTVVNGSWFDEKGKYRRGTVTDDKVCYDCDRQGITSFMIPDPPKLAKPAKPRRTKPKAVK